MGGIILKKDKQLTPSWDLLMPSIALLRKYFVEVAYLTFLPTLVISVGFTIYPHPHNPNETRLVWASVVATIGVLWALVSYPAFIYMLLQAAKHKSVGVIECYKKSFKYFWRVIGLQIIVGLIIFVGILLLIIPGLIALRRYYLAAYFLIDGNLTIREALRQSAARTKPVSGYIWGIIGVSVILSLAASAFGRIPVVGIVLPPAIALLYIFAPVLRYIEISKGKLPNLVKLDSSKNR